MAIPKLGTVWVAGAIIRYIDDVAGKWVPVGSCMDTPAAIGDALRAAQAAYPGKTLWVKSDSNGSYIPDRGSF